MSNGQRSSGEYVRWIQRSLNAILGSRLAVDGIIGALTREAVRTFQRQVGLVSDGIVGPLTEAALIAAGAGRPPQGAGGSPGSGSTAAVNTPLPAQGPGYYNKHVGSSRSYGLPQTIEALQAIGRTWARMHPGGPRIGIGDISFQGGGAMAPHSSHQKGLDIDIRPMRNDGREIPVRYTDSAYSRQLTQDLVDAIRSNPVLSVRTILFNDRGVRGVQPYPHHDDHLHVSFNPPDRRREEAYDRLDHMLPDVPLAAIPADLKQQMWTMARFTFSAYGPILHLLVQRALRRLRAAWPRLTPKAALLITARSMNLQPRRAMPAGTKLTQTQVRQFARRQQQRLPQRRRKRAFRLRRY